MMFYNNFCHEEVDPAVRKRDAMLRDGLLSRPASEVKLGLIVATALNRCRVDDEQAALFEAEARAIADTYHEQGKTVVKASQATVADVSGMLQDPTITDLCVIGEGGYGCIYLFNDDADENSGRAFDWTKVSVQADHLKTGNIYQRVCSVASISRVAWGTFASADVRKIWISEEPYFNPDTIHSTPETGLMPIYPHNVVSYELLQVISDAMSSRDLG